MVVTRAKSKMDSQSFPLFPKFPTEIRLKIWEAYAMLQPRIVEVCLLNDVENSDYKHRNTQNPFYSPTALPRSLFNINRESRSIAQSIYIFSFANGAHPAKIRWNPAIDTIFLPAWCFQYRVNDFMDASTEEEKSLIQKLAFETLVWYGDNYEGCINHYIQIDEFRNLREVMLVQRLPDHTGCGCCHEFDGPEEGVAGFKEIEEIEDDDEDEDEGDDAEVSEGAGAAVEVEKQQKRRTMSEDCVEEFLAIHKRDPKWRIPSVREVDLTRNGVII